MKLDSETLKKLKSRKIQLRDLNSRHFVSSVSQVEVENVLKLLNENICSFKEIVDKFKSLYALGAFLNTKLLTTELIENLIENNKLNKDNLKYLLNTIDNAYELDKLCDTAPLIGYILNDFMLNKKDVDKFNRMIENDGWCKDINIHNIFDRIEYFNKNNEEILKLNELNKKVCLLNNFDLNEDQKLELSEVLRDNEIALNKLQNIVVNKLEFNYDFESLMNYLKKKEKKNILNI